jgi:hypothetical protein
VSVPTITARLEMQGQRGLNLDTRQETIHDVESTMNMLSEPHFTVSLPWEDGRSRSQENSMGVESMYWTRGQMSDRVPIGL